MLTDFEVRLLLRSALGLMLANNNNRSVVDDKYILTNHSFNSKHPDLSLFMIYTCLCVAYKFALTLSCTQVSCERVFSVLKVIKNRLRFSLG